MLPNHPCRSSVVKRRLFSVGLALGALGASPLASASTYHYVDWTAADVAGGTATGTITLPGGSVVAVQFAAVNPDGSAGNLFGAQTAGGTSYWTPSAPFLSALVENAPPDADILQLSGGQNQVYKVTLSEPIKDPVMALVSLGQPGLPTTYDFDVPFAIVSQGVGYWGGSDSALTQLPGDVLQGSEGHGTIRFIGTFKTFSWTVPSPESWHGFTFAIRTTEALEPTDAGAPDSGGSSSGSTDVDAGSAPPVGTGDTGDTDPVDGPTPRSTSTATGSCGCSVIGARSAAATPVLLLGVAAAGLLVARKRRRA